MLLSYPKLYSLVYYESQNHGLKTGINILSYTSDVQFFLSLHMIWMEAQGEQGFVHASAESWAANTRPFVLLFNNIITKLIKITLDSLYT